MEFDEATALIFGEAHGDEGLAVTLRAGDDPGRQRVSQLLLALRIVFEGLRKQMQIDRALAYALFALAYDVEIATNVPTPSKDWSQAFIKHEQHQIAWAVRSIFADDWLGDVLRPS